MAALNAPRGIARLSRRLVSLQGRDAADFLQGMLSAALLTRDGSSVHHPPFTSATYAGLFTPNGRVLNDMVVYPRPPADASQAKPDYILEVDGNEASRLAKRFAIYKLRAKFKMRVLDPAEMGVFHLWDDAAREGLEGLRGGLKEGDTLCEDLRVPGLGWRALVAGGEVPQVGIEEVAEESYRLRRYLNGVPENQDEIPAEKALPLEYNMELMRGLSFEKGCYVGQELQARTRYLGTVQKRVLPCLLYDGDAIPTELEYKPTTAENGASAKDVESGSAIIKMPREGAPPPGARDRKPGKWIAGVGNVGIAVCRLAAMTDVVPPHPPDMEVPLKYVPEDEFKVEAGEGREVKVKAFAPEWLRQMLVGYRGE